MIPQKIEHLGIAVPSIAEALPYCSTADLLDGCTEPLDVFSYHYYNGISDRLASTMPSMHWHPDTTLSEAYLSVALKCCESVIPARDKYCPNGEMWVFASSVESGVSSVKKRYPENTGYRRFTTK